jgi:hypothetical protein
MPVYILDMLELPVEIKSAFEKGEFLVLVIPALSFIALLNDARKCPVSVHLTRADF